MVRGFNSSGVFTIAVFVSALVLFTSSISASKNDWKSATYISGSPMFSLFTVAIDDEIRDTISCDVAVLVNRKGKVERALVIRSSGHREIDRSAHHAALNIRYDFSGIEKKSHFMQQCYLQFSPDSLDRRVLHLVESRGRAYQLTNEIDGFVDGVLSLENAIGTDKLSPDEFLPVDFPAEAVQGLSIALEPGVDTINPVWLSILIDTSQLAVDMRISKSSGDPRKDTLAMLGVPSLKFRSAMIAGHAVRSWMSLKVTFGIDTTLVPQNNPYDEPSEMIVNAPVKYPIEARNTGLEGIVWIKSLIGISGEVEEAHVMKSSGVSALDMAALKAAFDCKFKPGMRDGKPIRMWVAYKVTFALSR